MGDVRRRLRLLRSVVGIACCAAVLGVVALSYSDGDATRRVALNGIDSDMESSITSIMQVLQRTWGLGVCASSSAEAFGPGRACPPANPRHELAPLPAASRDLVPPQTVPAA